jgi:Zn-dependent protease
VSGLHFVEDQDVLLGEPARTQYDLHFQLLGFGIRIHPGFWVVALLLGFRGSGTEPLEMLVWVVVLLGSITLHELGHTLMFRRYGISSHVVLYHFGGLAIPDSLGYMTSHGRSSRYQQLMISAAGPAIQLLLAVLVILALRMGGYSDGLVSRFLPAHYTADPLKTAEYFVSEAHAAEAIVPAVIEPKEEGKKVQIEMVIDLSRFQGLAVRDLRVLKSCDRDGNGMINNLELNRVEMAYQLPNRVVADFIVSLLYINIFWAILNLVPLYPLDGGQISRELFQLSGTSGAIEKSLMLSIATGVIIGLLGFRYGQPMICLMFFILAWSSYQNLQRLRGMGGGWG